MKFVFPYGEGYIPLNLPDDLTYLTPHRLPLVLPSSENEIASAVEELCSILPRRLTDNSSLLIIVDDITRPTPCDKILKTMLPAFTRLGIPESKIRILFALGTHHRMTPEEIAKKIGGDIAERITILQHDCYDEALLMFVGHSDFGYPLSFCSHLFQDHTFKIAISNVAPHPDVGWSGGTKMIYPGLAGYATIAGLHKQAGLVDSDLLGEPKTFIRKEIDSVVSKFGLLDYVMNIVLLPDQSIYDIVLGEPITAQEAATKICQKVFCTTFSEIADGAIVSACPFDMDFWQATKALIPASQIVKDRGSILLLAACPKGLGPHPALVSYLNLPWESLRNLVAGGTFEESLAGGIALQIKRIQQRVNVAIVSSSLSQEAANMMNFQWFPSAQEASQTGSFFKAGQKVALLADASITVPILSS